jgi:hypothetical protein
VKNTALGPFGFKDRAKRRSPRMFDFADCFSGRTCVGRSQDVIKGVLSGLLAAGQPQNFPEFERSVSINSGHQSVLELDVPLCLPVSVLLPYRRERD